jgi:hypothetical protein
LALCTIAAKLKPVLEVTVNGNHWKLVATSTFKTIVTEFELGVEFDEETPFGPKMKVNFNFFLNLLQLALLQGRNSIRANQ